MSDTESAALEALRNLTFTDGVKGGNKYNIFFYSLTNSSKVVRVLRDFADELEDDYSAGAR